MPAAVVVVLTVGATILAALAILMIWTIWRNRKLDAWAPAEAIMGKRYWTKRRQR